MPADDREARERYREKILDPPRGQKKTYWRDEWLYCSQHFEHFCRTWVWIIDIDGQEVLFDPNPTQVRYLSSATDMDLILKSRKLGFSTLKLIRGLWRISFKRNENCVVMAHIDDTAIELFDKLRFSFEKLPDFLRPGAKRKPRRELFLDRFPPHSQWKEQPCNSKYTLLSAQSDEPARGRDLSFVHMSEYAFFPKPAKIKAALLNARRRNAPCSIESTPNGQNDYYDEYLAGKAGTSMFRSHFFSWIEDPRCVRPVRNSKKWHPHVKKVVKDYRLSAEQGQFYEDKMEEIRDLALLKQEWPVNDVECFIASGLPFFDPETMAMLESRARDHVALDVVSL